MKTSQFTPSERRSNCLVCTLGTGMRDCRECVFYGKWTEKENTIMKASTYAQYRQVKVTKTCKEIFDRNATLKAIKNRLEYLRGEIEAERISYSENAELQELAKFIEPGDFLLLEWAGVPENG